MSLTTADFFERLRASEVLAAWEVDELWEGLSADNRRDTADRIVRKLVERKRLTQHQATALLEGRGHLLVLGDYVVLHKIGEGGMGQVFKARHRRMKRDVALKILPAATTSDPNSIKRFQREVEAAARLTHPNIVAAHDAGEQKGVHYLAIEFINGDDLANVVKKEGPLSVELALSYVAQAACGLAHAHRHGVIHRDIKPANLLLDPTGVVKILDMGLARFDTQIIDESVEGLTQSGAFMGTVDYVSPEQALDTRRAGPQADMYSLGCTLYFLLTGRRMYDADTMMQRLVAHREEPIPSLTSARSDVPADLPGIFEKLVAKRPENRFASMEDAREALQACRAALISRQVPQKVIAVVGNSMASHMPSEMPEPPPVCVESTGVVVQGESPTLVEPHRPLPGAHLLTRSCQAVTGAFSRASLAIHWKTLKPRAVILVFCSSCFLAAASLLAFRMMIGLVGTPPKPITVDPTPLVAKSPQSLADEARGAADVSRSEFQEFQTDLSATPLSNEAARATTKWEAAEAAYETGDFTSAMKDYDEAKRLFAIAATKANEIRSRDNDAAVKARSSADQARLAWQSIESELPAGLRPAASATANVQWKNAEAARDAGNFAVAKSGFEEALRQFDALCSEGAATKRLLVNAQLELEKLVARRKIWIEHSKDAPAEMLPEAVREAEMAFVVAGESLSRPELLPAATDRINSALGLYETATNEFEAAIAKSLSKPLSNTVGMELRKSWSDSLAFGPSPAVRAGCVLHDHHQNRRLDVPVATGGVGHLSRNHT